MSAVWVVRNRHGDIVHYNVSPYEQPDGWTVTRENLLTPAHAAVIEAAVEVVDMISDPKIKAWEFNQLFATVATLRKLEAQP